MAPAKSVYREILTFFHPLRIRLQICFTANKHKEYGELLCIEEKINARRASTTFRDLLYYLIKVLAFQKVPPRKPLIKTVVVMK